MDLRNVWDLGLKWPRGQLPLDTDQCAGCRGSSVGRGGGLTQECPQGAPARCRTESPQSPEPPTCSPCPRCPAESLSGLTLWPQQHWALLPLTSDTPGCQDSHFSPPHPAPGSWGLPSGVISQASLWSPSPPTHQGLAGLCGTPACATLCPPGHHLNPSPAPSPAPWPWGLLHLSLWLLHKFSTSMRSQQNPSSSYLCGGPEHDSAGQASVGPVRCWSWGR